MEQYFEKMNNKYIEKYYPNRSVFEKVAKSMKKGSMFAYIFFGLLIIGSIAGAVWIINQNISYQQSGDLDMAETGTIIAWFFGIFALLMLVPIVVTVLRNKKKSSDWMAICAKKSKLNETQLKEFEQQAMSSDSYILKLEKGSTAAVTGILTRDYVYLGDLSLTVIRCEDIASVCMVDVVSTSTTNNHTIKTHDLAIKILSKEKVEAESVVNKVSGKALIELLLERNPNINTFDGKVLKEREYLRYRDSESV